MRPSPGDDVVLCPRPRVSAWSDQRSRRSSVGAAPRRRADAQSHGAPRTQRAPRTL